MTSPDTRPVQASHRRRRRLSLPVVIGGVAAAFLLSLGLNSSVGAFIGSITNTTDTAGTGYLTMQETSGALTCNSTDGGSVSVNAANCPTINKFGGNLAMAPGTTSTVTIAIKNTGTVPATTFTLTPGSCTQAANGSVNGTATDLCAKVNVVVKSGSTTVFSGTAAALASGGAISLAALAPVAAGASVPFVFTTTLDPSAGATYQGLQISEPLTWTFNS